MHTFYVRHDGTQWLGELDGVIRAVGRTLNDLRATAAIRAELIDGPHEMPTEEVELVIDEGTKPFMASADARVISYVDVGDDRDVILTELHTSPWVLQLHDIRYSRGSLLLTSIDLPIDVAVWLVPALDAGARALSMRAGMKALGPRITGAEFGALFAAWPPPAWREQIRWAHAG